MTNCKVAAAILKLEKRRLQTEAAGFEVDYFAIRRAQNLERPTATATNWSCWLRRSSGNARLIDNIVVSI